MAKRNGKPKIFISHIEEDSALAISLKYYLERAFANALDIFVSSDRTSIKLGILWISEIVKELKDSSKVIILASPNSVTRPWIYFEAGGGLVRGANVIPVCIKGMKMKELPLYLGVLQACELKSKRELENLFVSIGSNFDFKCTIRAWSSVYNSIIDARTHEYIGRIDRAKQIINSIEDIIDDIKKSKRDIHIRMRATWTSMSNIKHYSDKEIGDLLPDQAEELDALLEKEREAIIKLLDMDGVKLKCICWPKLKYLASKYYTDKQKLERAEFLKDFLQKSLELNKPACRQLLCDESAAYGNQLIIDDKIVIMGNPKSGGYTETSVFEDAQVIDLWIREYDKQFKRIVRMKHLQGGNRKMLNEVLGMLDGEVHDLNKKD